MIINERDALKTLSNWFKKYNYKIWQDKKNILNNPTFHVTGKSLEKPDMMIKTNWYTIAIEVKTGTNSNQLGKYSKLLTYFENYNNKLTRYIDNENNEFVINFFVIGTNFSPLGHLRNFEQKHIDSPDSTRIKFGVPCGACPLLEYESTFQITRRAIWDYVDNDKYRNYNVGIGTLLSSCLNGKNTQRPAIHIMKPCFDRKKQKNIWRQKWMIL